MFSVACNGLRMQRRSWLALILSWPSFSGARWLTKVLPMYECTFMLRPTASAKLPPIFFRLYTNGSVDACWAGKDLERVADTHGWFTFRGHGWNLRVKRDNPRSLLVSHGYYLKAIETA